MFIKFQLRSILRPLLIFLFLMSLYQVLVSGRVLPSSEGVSLIQNNIVKAQRYVYQDNSDLRMVMVLPSRSKSIENAIVTKQGRKRSMNLSQRLRLVSLDKKQWQRLYYKNQQAYIRQRLSAIRYLSEGKSRAEVAQLLGCTDLTIARWIVRYLETGLEGLVEPIKHQVKERLTPQQSQELKEMVLNQRPTKYGIDREIWTGKIIAFVIQQKWGIELKTSRIYEILDRLNLSHQKAHRDYENADPVKQKKFVKLLKKNAHQKAWGENSLL